jgi:ActR/RegA family two-component response regulator
MQAELQSSEDSAALPRPEPGRRVERVLLVEDSMLIALDAEDSLVACGVGEVVMASSVAAALAAIGQEPPDFAVLDYNLGDESSEPIARALAQAGVPFCFATGYGDALERTCANPPYGVLKKPYSAQDIAVLLARVEADLAGGD